MKFLGKLLNLHFLFKRKMDGEVAKKLRFVSGVMQTSTFSRLSIQDKVLSLGRLIMMFRADCGFTPKSLEKRLETLNSQLNRQTHQMWQTLYSEPIKCK